MLYSAPPSLRPMPTPSATFAQAVTTRPQLPIPAAISLPADLAPGGTVVYCKEGVKLVQAMYVTKVPLVVKVQIICKKDKQARELIIQ